MSESRQLLVDDAWNAHKEFSQLADKIESPECSPFLHVLITYSGPPAYAIYQSNGRKKKNGNFTFKKTKLIFDFSKKVSGQ